jgi:hypothetical protein
MREMQVGTSEASYRKSCLSCWNSMSTIGSELPPLSSSFTGVFIWRGVTSLSITTTRPLLYSALPKSSSDASTFGKCNWKPLTQLRLVTVLSSICLDHAPEDPNLMPQNLQRRSCHSLSMYLSRVSATGCDPQRREAGRSGDSGIVNVPP